MGRIIYLDHAATTAVDPDVLNGMMPYFVNEYGNPQTLYSLGISARKAIEEARLKISSFLGSKPEEIFFTSGGTESDNLAIKGTSYANIKKGRHIITSSIEHNAVIKSCNNLIKEGWEVSFIPVNKFGIIDPEDIKKTIRKDTVLITIMHANNEIGTIQPVREIGNIARENEIYFHMDAVQTFGQIPVKVNDLNVDLLSISSHKLYGPKGVGCLYIKRGTKISSTQHGGGQEGGKRAGTENVPGIVGLGFAAEIASTMMESEIDRVSKLRNKFVSLLFENIDRIYLNGDPSTRLPNNVNISIESAEGEAMIIRLDSKGICASTASACSSGTGKPSHVLSAIGVKPEHARTSLRFTLGRENNEDDIISTVMILKDIVKDLRDISPFP